MNKTLERALLLYQQSRYQQAIGELQLQLAQDSDDSFTHALLALCHAELEHFDDATQHAQRAIFLAPDQAFGHYALARVLIDRRRLPEAKQAIEEAIRLSPHDADYFGILASIHLLQSRWREAFETANQGLELDPEHTACTNLRAQAQVKLGDRAGAGVTIDKALQRRPDDPYSHANQGWAMLEAGQPKQALEHFREALRLKPDLEWARAGIVEAMKAHNFIYRWMLAYFLWMAKLSPRTQWILLLGGLFGQRVLFQIAEKSPAAAPFVWPIIILYAAFVLMTWLASPLFNLLLRFNRFGRQALSPDQVRGANLLAGCLLIAAGCCVAGLWFGNELLILSAIYWVLLALPVSAIYQCDEGWPRTTMIACSLALLAMVLCVAIPAVISIVRPGPVLFGLAIVIVMRIFPYCALGSQLLAAAMVGVRPRK